MKVVICRPSHGGAYRKHEKCFRRLLHAHPDWEDLPLPGFPCIDIARAVLAEWALARKADVLLWLDADMTFAVETCEVLVQTAHDLQCLVGCVYAKKQLGGEPNVSFPRGTTRVGFFELGGLIPIDAIGFGVVAHSASVLDRVAKSDNLHGQYIGEQSFRPFFTNDPAWDRMHSDDYSFCRRARKAGVPLYADTRHRVGHIGEYVYHLEDMGDLGRRASVLSSQFELVQADTEEKAAE